ncbi:MAG: hypothetical protein ACTSVZ_10090, partial [Promethearchaeota archaeon]
YTTYEPPKRPMNQSDPYNAEPDLKDCILLDFTHSQETYGIDISRNSLQYFAHSEAFPDLAKDRAILMRQTIEAAYLGLQAEIDVAPLPIVPTPRTCLLWHLYIQQQVSPPTYQRFIQAFLQLALYQPYDIHCVMLYQNSHGGSRAVLGPPIFRIQLFFYCNLPDTSSISHSIRGNSANLESIFGILHRLLSALASTFQVRFYPSAAEVQVHLTQLHTLTGADIGCLQSLSLATFWNYIHGDGWYPTLPSHHLISPMTFDLHFPNHLKIPESICLPSDNFALHKHPASVDHVVLGSYVHFGRPTPHPVSIPIDDLCRHISIFGKPGFGKTHLLFQLTDEIRRKRPQMGQLIIGVGKEDQDVFYRHRVDIVLKFGDPYLRIQYLPMSFLRPRNSSIDSSSNFSSSLSGNLSNNSSINSSINSSSKPTSRMAKEKYLQQIANFITCAMGLSNPFDSYVHTILKRYEENQNYPGSLETLISEQG